MFKINTKHISSYNIRKYQYMYLILEKGKSTDTKFHNDVYPFPGIFASHCFNDII